MFQAVLGSWFQPPWPLAFNAGPIAETRVTADWQFMREGVPPGRYTPNVLSNFSPPPGWFLKSATIEGRIDMGEKVLINIRTFCDGHAPPDRVLETEF